MRILVTGSDGFVGKHLVAELRAHGHDVVGSDKTDTDLAQPWYPFLLVKHARPEYVVHLAARYGRILCSDEPHSAVADNAAATTEIAMVCSELGIPVLYTSTSEVYGDHGVRGINEDSELLMPTTIYGLSKRWGEEALRLYMDPKQLCIVRPNMLYGPGQHAGYGQCALATFIQQALKNEPLTVHHAASRSWLYIGDAVRALRLLVEQGHTGVFNLGNSMERTGMRALADLVCEITNSKSEIYEIDAPPGQIRHKVYNASKLMETLGWWPRVVLRDGIEAAFKAPAFVRPAPC